MFKYRRITRFAVLLACTLLVSACSTGENGQATQVEPDTGAVGPTAVRPTKISAVEVQVPEVDADQVRTEAASTVIAGMTATSDAAPLAIPTEAPPTPTNPPPTPEPPPSLPEDVEQTATTIPLSEVGSEHAGIKPTPVQPPPNPLGPTPTMSNFECGLTSQTPKDGITFDPGEEFTVEWTLQNLGTAIWNKDYHYTYYRGNDLRRAFDPVRLSDEVKTWHKIVLKAELVAPHEAGYYITFWRLFDPEWSPVCTVYYEFYVSN